MHVLRVFGWPHSTDEATNESTQVDAEECVEGRDPVARTSCDKADSGLRAGLRLSQAPQSRTCFRTLPSRQEPDAVKAHVRIREGDGASRTPTSTP